MTAMGLLLAEDTVTLYPPGDRDAHGWREPGTGPCWSGTGNLQLAPGPSDPLAGPGGGHGPSGPAAGLDGQLFLPEDAAPAEGMTADIADRLFTLSQVRTVPDPFTRAGGIGCWAATVTSVPRDEEEAEPGG